MRKLACALCVMAIAAGSAAAQKKIDDKLPAQADGLVRISNLAGSVRISGWERDEISLSGNLPSNVERVDFSSEGGLATISVVLRRNSWSSKSTEIEIRLPFKSSLDIETVSADIAVADVRGKMRLSSVSGSIRVEGGVAAFIANSTSGAIDIEANGGGGRARTISGYINLRDPGGEVRAESVSGAIAIRGGKLENATIETTAGKIKLDTDLAKGARVDATTMSGSIELVFPADLSAAFELSSFSGKIESDFKSGSDSSADFSSGSLSFSTGNDARVVAECFSGKISLKRR
jgi:DUF4097 and DUF4098 domain-containing protein YvlB